MSGVADDHIDFRPAAFELLQKFLIAGIIRAGFASFVQLLILGNDQNAHLLAGSVRKRHRAANHLIRLLGIDTETHCHLDRLVELGLGVLFINLTACSSVRLL